MTESENANELRAKLAALDKRLPELARDVENARGAGHSGWRRNAESTLESAQHERAALVASIASAERRAAVARDLQAERERVAASREAAAANYASGAIRVLERRVKALETSLAAFSERVDRIESNRPATGEAPEGKAATDGNERRRVQRQA